MNLMNFFCSLGTWFKCDFSFVGFCRVLLVDEFLESNVMEFNNKGFCPCERQLLLIFLSGEGNFCFLIDAV